MTEKFVMAQQNLPDGILHDQHLYNISFENRVLILSFEIKYFSDMQGNAFCERYRDFTKCHVKCRLEEESVDFSNVELITSLNDKFKAKYKLLTISDFVRSANQQIHKAKEGKDYLWEYGYTYVSPNINSAVIELSISLKYGRTEYSMCRIELNTREMEFVWE